jgi:undecaprenyl-diphosphatase
MTLAEAALLGLIQGLAEWLPVSSEGVLTAVQSFAFGAPLPDAVNFSLWLHLGTVISALAAFRSDVWDVVRDIARRPASPSPMTAYLILATLSSAPLGFLLLLGLFEFSEIVGAVAMAAVGILMLVTGAVLIKSKSSGTRTRDDMRWSDAVLTGIAQGLAALPGLSRSGLTVSALLWRGVDRREALTLSFILSIPASLGAGLYAALSAGYYASPEAAAALAVSALTGFVTIRALMSVAQRLNFGWFVLLLGAGIIAGSIWIW